MALRLAPDSSEIVQLIRDRNIEGLKMLYDRYAAIIFGFLVNSLSDNKKAEQLLPLVFRKYWDEFFQYNPDDMRLLYWMIMKAREMVSEKENTRDAIEGFSNLHHRYERSEANEKSIAGKGLLHDNIDNEYKKILDAFLLRNLTLHQVASTSGLPLGTVKLKLRSVFEKILQLNS